MAEEKKKEDNWDFDPIETFIVIIFLAAISTSLIPMIWNYITSGNLTFYGYSLSGIFDFFRNNVLFFKILGFMIAGTAAITAFIYTKKGDEVWREEKAKIYPSAMPAPVSTDDVAREPDRQNGRWQRILELSSSGNPSDWKFAIIEADIILDELLNKLQLPGETMGEKLKAVEKSDFLTIEAAWEAHKFRNNIAHEGNNFLVNQHEISRIISLYEAVFREFEII